MYIVLVLMYSFFYRSLSTLAFAMYLEKLLWKKCTAHFCSQHLELWYIWHAALEVNYVFWAPLWIFKTYNLAHYDFHENIRLRFQNFHMVSIHHFFKVFCFIIFDILYKYKSIMCIKALYFNRLTKRVQHPFC